MRRLSIQKTLLIVAGGLSLLAQWLLFLPKMLNFLLQSFAPRGSVALGAAFFAFSLLLLLIVIGRQFADQRLAWRPNGILLLTQVVTVIGIYLLSDGLPSGERGAGFLLSGLITILTTYGIFNHTIR